MQPSDVNNFKEFLLGQVEIDPPKREQLLAIAPADIYTIARLLGITNGQIAKYISDFLKLPYLSQINPYDIKLDVLPKPFCKANLVAAMNDGGEGTAFVLSNPFNWELMDNLDKLREKDQPLRLLIAEPEQLELLFKDDADMGVELTDTDSTTTNITQNIEIPPEQSEQMLKSEIEKHPIIYISNTMLNKAIAERASDIHIEPKETDTIIRFRVDGDLRDAFSIKQNTGVMLISRLKVLGGLDLAEKRKPQDGSFAATVHNKSFKFRLATTSTPYGESMIIRILEPSAKPRDLSELGMTEEQTKTMVEFANRTHGVVLIVGPTGSGKTTTIYSFLFNIDCQARSLISAEDPVEYSIPSANQQQVNVKAGITFESILKSAVRQYPDILLGEVRDPFSAKMSMDFASTGHMTVTTLHTSNATTAIFRLERLEVDRGTMADTIVGVIAQRLMKKLCPHCKEVTTISMEERDMLAPFTKDVPSQVAHPVGCAKCNSTGYHGREGIYEIIRFDHEIADRIRSGVHISEIRTFMKQRGDFLISDHAVQKVKELLFAPKDAFEHVLVEEMAFTEKTPEKDEKEPPRQPAAEAVAQTGTPGATSILVVEDDEDSRKLIARLLENNAYLVTLAEDGVSALLQLGKKTFDLIISDVNMPNMNGFKLLEMKGQKGIDTPVIFLTSRSEQQYVDMGYGLGATDYITKPTKKAVLLATVEKALQKQNKE